MAKIKIPPVLRPSVGGEKEVQAAGDTIGGTAHKFSSGSFTEGRIAGKAAVKYVNDLKSAQPQVSAHIASSSVVILAANLELEAEAYPEADAATHGTATGLIGVVINLLMRFIERKTLSWHSSIRSEVIV